MESRNIFYVALVGVCLALLGCGGGGGSTSAVGGSNTNFPYLKAVPQVTYIQNVFDTSKYDVTVTLEADGPDGVFFVDLWLYDKNNVSNFAHMDLYYVGGTTWMATTNSLIPLPAGDYYLDSIIIEDGEPLDGGIVKTGWYFTSQLSGTNYKIDQRETNWTTLELINYNFGVSNIPVVNFALP